MNATIRERALFKLGQHGVRYEDAKKIRRLAASYNTIQERLCSEEMSDLIREKVDAQEGAIVGKIVLALAPYGLQASFAGDPRGFTVIVRGPSDEEGFGIA